MSGSLLYLVRHAAVVTRGDVPVTRWQLSAAGERAAHGLAQAPAWRSLAVIAASPEAKAIATARPIAAAAGLELRTDPALCEVDRGATPLVAAAAYEAMVAAHFASPDERVAGWERGVDAAARICHAIDRLVAEADGPACVVSHGLVLSHYLARLRGLPAPSIDEWRAIPMPGVAVVDVARRELVAPFR